MATVTKPMALDETLQATNAQLETTDATPVNIADVLQTGLANVASAIGSNSAGHTIQDSDGQDMPQRVNLQFADSHVSDDSVNGRTVVENIKEVAPADYDSTTDEGIIVSDDGNDVPIGASSDDYVEVTADGVKTIGTLLNELASQVDFTKLLDNAHIQENINGVINNYFCRQHRNNSATFFSSSSESSGARVITYYVKANSSLAEISTGTSYSDVTASQKPSDGAVIRIYYGTSSTVINLKTDANYCQYDENTTVKQKIDRLEENEIANYVDLSSYTSDWYTFPSDGYLQAGTAANAIITVRLRGKTSQYNVTLITSNGDDSLTYVRKGMRAILYGSTGNVSLRFYALT